ncbi:MAG: methylthioribulose 1-phosphate dehydratase [Bacilli bacterium]
MQTFFEQLEAIRNVKTRFASRGWFFGTSGNLSVRVNDAPLQFLVTRSGIDKQETDVNDFILVDGSLQSVWNPNYRPSLEASLHLAVYERTAATCVLHVHTLANNVISKYDVLSGEFTVEGVEIIKAFDLWEEDASVSCPIIPNYAHIPALTNAFIPHITADFGAVLIAGHGITAWGRTPKEATKVLEAWEFLFQYRLEQLKINATFANV